MPNYNQKAIEGHVYCWQTQRKPPNFAHAGLLKITISEVWSLEDVKEFYNKIDRGEYTLQGDDAFKGFIYCLYRQKQSFKSAYTKICKVLGEDEMKIEDVQEIYQKIEEGYNMELISLEGIMKLMNEKIVNELDMKSRLSLKNTSKALRSLIDNGNYKTKFLIIEIEEERIAIRDVYQGYRCAFRKQGNKCAVCENGEYILVKGAFWKRAEKGLKLLLGVNNNTKIEKLTLEAPRYFEPKLTFVDVLGSLDKKLKVKTLYFNTPNHRILHHIADLMTCLDPHELEELTTPCYLPGFFANQIFGTEHWKNIKTFKSGEIFYRDLGNTFGHFNRADFRPLGFPTIAQLIQLKGKLLQNQNLELMELSHRLERKQINELKSQFNQIADFKTPFHVIPATDQKILSVFIDSSVVAFKGPCCEVSFFEDIAMLEGTVSKFYETLQKEWNGCSDWYHFNY